MKRHIVLAALVGLLGTSCTLGGADAAPVGTMKDLVGTWTVSSEFCNLCGVAPHADDGHQIVVAATTYRDPYNLDCQGAARYTFTAISRTDAQHALGVPRSVYRLPESSLTLVRLECPVKVGNEPAVPLPSARMILLGQGRAIYLWEGSTNFVLRRRSR